VWSNTMWTDGNTYNTNQAWLSKSAKQLHWLIAPGDGLIET
jgi:hypothetical protein